MFPSNGSSELNDVSVVVVGGSELKIITNNYILQCKLYYTAIHFLWLHFMFPKNVINMSNCDMTYMKIIWQMQSLFTHSQMT